MKALRYTFSNSQNKAEEYYFSAPLFTIKVGVLSEITCFLKLLKWFIDYLD